MTVRAATAVAILIILAACGDTPDQQAAPTPAPVAVVIATVEPSPSPTPEPTATPAPTSIPIPTPTRTPVPTPTFAPRPVILPTVTVPLETATPVGSGPVDVERRISAIGYQTSLIRDLSAVTAVTRELLTKDELQDRVIAEYEEDREELEIRERLYKRLGIIGGDVDLYDVLTGAVGSVVIGMFDTDEETLYVAVGEEGFSLQNELTVAHEVVHSLQQANFDIGGLSEGLKGNQDRRRALRALVEGDASVTEYLYSVKYFDEQQQQEAQEEAADVDISAYLEAPLFIQRTIAFPYVDGPQFVVSLIQQSGDFSLVDAAFEDLPASTEQIIHPEKYGVEEPVEVSLPDLGSRLGEGWTELDRDVAGELFFRSMMAARLDAATANSAAAGWGGDAYVLLETPSGDDAVISLSTWDTREDAAEFAQAVVAYFSSDQGEWEVLPAEGATSTRLVVDNLAVELHESPQRVRVIVAGNEVDLDTLVATLGSEN